MCTWSAIRWPSSIRLCCCSARRRNTSPRYCRSSLYNVLRRHLGMKITWYLHSHLLWLKLSYSSIRDLLLVCLAAPDLEFLGWTPSKITPVETQAGFHITLGIAALIGEIVTS